MMKVTVLLAEGIAHHDVQQQLFPPSKHMCILCCIMIAASVYAGMLRKVFISFASFAVRTPTEDLDGAKFSKLCKDAKLLGRNLSTIEVDIVFAKVKVGNSTFTK